MRTIDGRASDDTKPPGSDPDPLLDEADLSVGIEANEIEAEVAHV